MGEQQLWMDCALPQPCTGHNHYQHIPFFFFFIVLQYNLPVVSVASHPVCCGLRSFTAFLPIQGKKSLGEHCFAFCDIGQSVMKLLGLNGIILLTADDSFH